MGASFERCAALLPACTAGQHWMVQACPREDCSAKDSPTQRPVLGRYPAFPADSCLHASQHGLVGSPDFAAKVKISQMKRRYVVYLIRRREILYRQQTLHVLV